MKLTAWQMVAALAVLFGAILAAYRFAPGAVTVVVPMVTTAFAALGLNLKSADPPPPESPEIGFKVIDGGKG